MGSHMKQAIFEEQTANALRKWQKKAKEKRKLRIATERGDDNLSGFSSVASTPSRASSPLPLLHKYKTGDIESTLASPRYMNYHNMQTELTSDVGGSPPSNVSSDIEAKQNVKGRGSAFTFHSP